MKYQSYCYKNALVIAHVYYEDEVSMLGFRNDQFLIKLFKINSFKVLLTTQRVSLKMQQCIQRMLTIAKQMWQFITSTSTVCTPVGWHRISTQFFFALCDRYWVGVSHCTHVPVQVTNFSLPSFSMWGHIRPPCTIQPHITTMLLQARIYTFNRTKVFCSHLSLFSLISTTRFVDTRLFYTQHHTQPHIKTLLVFL